MAKFFPVSPGIWNKRLLDLGRSTALLYAYILSNPHRASEGLYRCPIIYMAADLGFEKEEVVDGLRALEREGLIAYDHDAEVVFDPTALFYLPPGSEKQIKGAITRLRQVPRTPLMRRFIEAARAYAPNQDEPTKKNLVTEMENAFPELFNDDFPNTSQTLSDESLEHSHRGRGRQSGDELGVPDGDPALPLLRAQRKRAQAESDHDEVERVTAELRNRGEVV